MSAATYCPAKTEHRQAAARVGLRLKHSALHHAVVVLIDDRGDVVFSGSREGSWDFLRSERGLRRGEH